MSLDQFVETELDHEFVNVLFLEVAPLLYVCSLGACVSFVPMNNVWAYILG